MKKLFSVGRFVRIFLLFICLLILSGSAQADLAEFEKALDSWELKSAERALETLAGPNQKVLGQAEFYLKKQRTELALKALEQLQLESLSPQEKAKFLLVRATLESNRSEADPSQSTSTVLRLIRDGLRNSPSPRDKSRLLLLRIAVAPPGKMALAEEAETELAELESVDDLVDLTAQAMLLAKKGRYAQAARLWSNLATLSKSSGETNQQYAFQFLELEALRDAGKLEAAQKLREELWEQVLQAKDPFLARRFWESERKTGKENRISIAEKLREALGSSEERLMLVAWLASINQERAVRVDLVERAAEEAQALEDPILRAFFLYKIELYSNSTVKGERLKSEIGALTKGYDLDYLKTAWYSGVRSALDEYKFLGREDVTEQKLSSSLSGLSGDQRLNMIRKYLEASIQVDKPDMLFKTTDMYLEEFESLPALNRYLHLDRLLHNLYFAEAFYPFTHPPEKRGIELRAQARSVVDVLQEHPTFISSILDTYLTRLNTERDPETLAQTYRSLARWMALLGRNGEARDLLQLASALNIETEEAHLLELELLLNSAQSAPLTTAQVDRLAFLKQQRATSPWAVLCQMGWLELYCNRPSRAQMWAQRALAEKSGVQKYEFLRAAPNRLLAHAKARLGKTEEALSILDREEKEYPLESSKILFSRALILSQAQRHREAYIATLGVDDSPLISKTAPVLTLRATSARESGREKAAEEAEAELAKFLEEQLSLSRYPRVAEHLNRELAKIGKVELRTPVSLTDFRGLGPVVERLEALRRREPDSQSLRRLGAAEIRELSEKAGENEIFVQPILLSHSVVLLSAVKGDVCLQEVVCNREKVEKALLNLSTKLSSPTIDVKFADSDQEYLSRILVKPWQSLFPSKTKLRWLGDGELNKIPVSALPGLDGKPLVHHLSTAYLDGPSYPRLNLPPKLAALVVGGAKDLPGATRELSVVRKTFARGESWNLGEKFESLQDFAGRHSVVHFATHGKAPVGQSASGTLAGDSGSLTAFQLAELTFPEDSLAVLGSCESHLDAKTGRDNTSLVSALRTAGAKVVVGSLWRLDDDTTADLFTHFYDFLGQGSEPDLALALAQRAVLAQDSHPYYWAGVQVVSGP